MGDGSGSVDLEEVSLSVEAAPDVEEVERRARIEGEVTGKEPEAPPPKMDASPNDVETQPPPADELTAPE